MRILRLESKGVYVETLQLALKRAGYYKTEPDGIFGPRTAAAVIAFQRDNRLLPDGIVGPLTWSRLRPYLQGYVIHTAVRGDTFWRLAEQYRTDVQAIITANPDIDPLNIPIGARLVVPLGFDVVPTGISYSYFLLEQVIEGLAARYPFIRTGSIGESVMGRELYLLTIGEGTEHVSYNAAHHANEWITTPILLRFTEDLAYAYSINGQVFGANARDLLKRVTCYIVPMVNPDGVDLVTGALPTDSEYFRNAKQLAEGYPDIPFPSGWKANILGTDLNLNYPADWETARDIKFAQGYTMPGPRDFVGTMPLSEPESAAMHEFTMQNNFGLILAYHTQGEVIFWKYLDYEPQNALEIGREMSQASGYPLEITPEGSAYAGYKDWFIAAYNKPGYTIEAGRGQNPLPIDQFNKIYRDNLGILTIGLKMG